MRSAIPVYILLQLPVILTGQIIFTRTFTNKLLDAGAAIRLSGDDWFNVVLPQTNQIVDFDLYLESVKDSAELRFKLVPAKEADKMIFPEPYIISMVANLATNDRGYWISSRHISERDLIQIYKAEWAIEMSFVPKSSETDKKYGKAFAMYRADYGMIYSVLFYNHEYPGFNAHLRTMYFNAPLNH